MLEFMRIVESVHREPPHLVRGRRSGGRPRRPLLVGGGQCGTRWDGVQRRVLPRLLLLLLLEKVGECVKSIPRGFHSPLCYQLRKKSTELGDIVDDENSVV